MDLRLSGRAHRHFRGGRSFARHAERTEGRNASFESWKRAYHRYGLRVRGRRHEVLYLCADALTFLFERGRDELTKVLLPSAVARCLDIRLECVAHFLSARETVLLALLESARDDIVEHR